MKQRIEVTMIVDDRIAKKRLDANDVAIWLHDALQDGSGALVVKVTSVAVKEID